MHIYIYAIYRIHIYTHISYENKLNVHICISISMQYIENIYTHISNENKHA